MTTQTPIQLHYTDNEPIYRRMLEADDPAIAEAIFRDELLGPYVGLFQIFGGADPVQMARQWSLHTPEHVTGPEREKVFATLDALASANAFADAQAALQDAITAFAPFTARIALQSVQAGLFLGDLSQTPGQRGYTGFGGLPGYVMVIYDTPDDYNLPRIKGATAHELNHNVRFTAFPFNPMAATVGEYIIAEGLAESFAAELYGEDIVGYYVTEFDQSRLEETRAIVHAALDKTGFDAIRAYIFGDRIAEQMAFPAAGVPDFAGYALGYHIVQAYIQKTGKSVAEATFIPADEIIQVSGYFL